MALLLLLLLVPLLWFMLLPLRVAGRLRKHPFAGMSLILGALVVGWFGLQALATHPDKAADYAEGDAALRAMLE